MNVTIETKDLLTIKKQIQKNIDYFFRKELLQMGSDNITWQQ